MPVCSDCGGTVIEYDTAAGNGICVSCGTVIEENSIVSEVTFGETSTGAAMVQGSFVGQGATHARMSGPYGNRGSSESREQTIANASKKIQSIANALRLSDIVCLSATRMYTLAVEHKFTKGRKSLNVVAVCLYIACRQKETRNYMLIDFSDLLQVNVFELGHTYLQLVQTLNLRLPLVDPSHYISRFAALLEFGDETHKVASDAIRLVQRFDRDWMTRGRRPAGICGAALLLAARMNNFRRSVEEIVQVVKIADTTLKKRLDEFKATPSGALTLADFRSVWLDEEMDPPAFIKGKEKESQAKLADAEEAASSESFAEGTAGEQNLAKSRSQRRRKRKRAEEDEIDDQQNTMFSPSAAELPARVPIDPALLNEGILCGTNVSDRLAPSDEQFMNIDPSLLPPVSECLMLPELPPENMESAALVMPPIDEVEDTMSTLVAEEVTTFLHNAQGTQLADALEEAAQRRLAQVLVDDELLGLDEDELDKFILSEDEVRIKERVWVELNKDYLEALAAKGEQRDYGAPKSRKRRKAAKPRDASTPHGSSAAESVQNLLRKNPKYSKRINYNALKDLFDGAPLPAAVTVMNQRILGMGSGIDDSQGEEAELYTMDDKSDGESIGMGLVVIEEEAGCVPALAPASVEVHARRTVPMIDGDVDVDSDRGEDDVGPLSWEDAYEQEV